MVNYAEHPKPQFRISLTKDQVTELGRLSVIWGQLDHFTIMAVTKLIAADGTAGTIIMKEMTTGSLIGLLRKSLSRIKDTKIRAIAEKYCKDMGSLIEYRNHIAHGIWGWRIPGKDPKKAKPACLYLKEPKREVYPDKITDTADRAAVLTHNIYAVVCHLHGHEKPSPENPHPRYFFNMAMADELILPEGLKLESL